MIEKDKVVNQLYLMNKQKESNKTALKCSPIQTIKKGQNGGSPKSKEESQSNLYNRVGIKS